MERDPPFLMGNSAISMVSFNGYLDIPRGFENVRDFNARMPGLCAKVVAHLGSAPVPEGGCPIASGGT